MPLLLLFSALLTALTGAVAGARPVTIAVERTRAIEVRHVAVASVTSAGDHRHLLGGRAAAASFATSVAIPTIAAARVPLYRDRPRA